MSEMKRILEFLGLPYETVKPSTVKQSNQPLSEAILNYHDLKKKFVDTPWELYFEE